MEKLLITSYFSFSHNDFKRQKATYVFFYSPEYSSSGNGPSAQKKLKVDGSINNTKTLTELGISAQASTTSITLSRPTGKALKKTTITSKLLVFVPPKELFYPF